MKSKIWVFLGAASLAITTLAADEPVKFSELPAAVQQTMRKEIQATGAKIKNTLIEIADGKTYYECESILANGKTRDFLVDPRGNVSEVEDQIEESELPAAVKAVVEKTAASGGKITKLESVKKDGNITGYEATVVKNGKKKGIELNPYGTKVK